MSEITAASFVQACEALAEVFEGEGRADLAALCDKAGYWLNGGTGVDVMSVSELVESCQETLKESLAADDIEAFVANSAQEIAYNLQSIEADVVTASHSDDDLLERAAKLQTVAILTSYLFHKA